MSRVNLMLAAAILAASLSFPAQAEQGAAQEKAMPASAESASQRFARDRLLEMARFLGSTQKASVTLHVGYEVMQTDGQMVEFGEIRDLWMQRPDKLRVEETASDGGQSLTLFDGKQITVFDGDTGAYAQAPQPGSIDDALIYFVRDLRMRLPLAVLLMEKSADELQRRIRRIEYVERTNRLGQPAHHIAGRTADVDFQVWIADSKQPLPLRVVLSYPKAEGKPHFRTDFADWNLAPKFEKSTFAFKPPTGATQIIFAVQLEPRQVPEQK